jgi:hypothetical protein
VEGGGYDAGQERPVFRVVALCPGLGERRAYEVLWNKSEEAIGMSGDGMGPWKVMSVGTGWIIVKEGLERSVAARISLRFDLVDMSILKRLPPLVWLIQYTAI